MSIITQNIALQTGSREEKKAEIRAYFLNTYELYEKLFETLASPEVLYEQPQPLRHPLTFYYGHTAVFFVNKLLLAQAIPVRINAHYESLFAIGVDEMSWDDLNTQRYTWPTVNEVKHYRAEVKAIVLSLIDTLEIALPIMADSPWWIIMMGIEHERIHLETSSVLIRQLPIDLVKPHPLFPLCPTSGPAPENSFVTIPPAHVTLGKKSSDELYGWDNEYGHVTFAEVGLEVSTYLVSNQEYLAFVEDQGYQTDSWWSEEGLAWRNYYKATYPEFWVPSGASYKLRTLTHLIDLPLNWPVEVCYLEAAAFCAWKSNQLGKDVRLPDEAEYTRMRDFAGITEEHCVKPVKANWNLEQYASSTPIDANMHGPLGDVVGNVWQWNETPIYGFEGFAVHPIYDDFSVPTFDNRHNLIKGGSWISTGNEIALRSRYAFRRHFYQHAGFRYVHSTRLVKRAYDMYESDELVAQYCEFHYGDTHFGVPNFSKVIAHLGIEASKSTAQRKVLDIGCSVGRTAFELAATFAEIDALDFSARFIQVGVKMQQVKSVRYERAEEGKLTSLQERSLASLGLTGQYDHINFMQQDATNMKPHFTGYDLVIAANLIDRLRTPAQFLRDIGSRINPGGILLIASPYTWLESFTPLENWLGGFERDGATVTTLEGLHHALDEVFISLGTPQKVPFVIRETPNKYQHTLSEVTLWQRK